MIKFGRDDYDKKTRFQMFMTSAGFRASSTGYKALAAKGIEMIGSFLLMEAKLFSKKNLDRDGLQGFTTGEVLKLQNLWMWAYCR